MAGGSSLAHRLYTGELSYDFVGKRKRWYLVSAGIIAVCLLAILIRGLNLSIDFTGGSEFSVPVQVSATTVDDFRETVQGLNLPDTGDIKVNTIGDNQVRVQVRALSAEEINQVTAALSAKAGVATDQVTNNLIGASWGQQITQQGLLALAVFLVLVSLLIWGYFRNWKMSVSAIIALLHDLAVTVGVYALLQFSFTPASLIGILTILGYSLYDTVVVFDKVRENTHEIERQSRTFSEATSAAVNQVLVRSINTTIIGVLPVAALLITGTFILGTGPLKDLGLALFVGMVAGAYSSIFLAAPLFAQMKELEPAQVAHRARLTRRTSRHAGRGDESVAVATDAASGQASRATVLASTGAPVDPVQLGTVRPEQLRERHQPKTATRSQRKKDGR